MVNSIEGLKYENVSVETFAAAPAPVQIAGAPDGEGGGGLIALLVAVGVITAGLLGYPAFRRWRLRRSAATRRAIVPQEIDA